MAHNHSYSLSQSAWAAVGERATLTSFTSCSGTDGHSRGCSNAAEVTTRGCVLHDMRYNCTVRPFSTDHRECKLNYEKTQKNFRTSGSTRTKAPQQLSLWVIFPKLIVTRPFVIRQIWSRGLPQYFWYLCIPILLNGWKKEDGEI